MSRRVVVTGMGALTPIGNNLNDYWEALKAGKSGAALITKFDTEKFKAKFACELKSFNSLDHFDSKEVRKYDLFSQYALVAVEEAVKHAEIDFMVFLHTNLIGITTITSLPQLVFPLQSIIQFHFSLLLTYAIKI